MSFSWKQYEGQVINNTFPLQQYLGGSSESAVFLTQLAGPQSSKAVVKLVPEGPSVDMQLSLWRRASKLTHPNLLQLYQGGRCHLADMDLLYVVMEYAEEDLSQILPQRALTPAEARDMLGPVLDALSDLHGQGLVHSRLKPSNVLATSDQVKLSTDKLFPAGVCNWAVPGIGQQDTLPWQTYQDAHGHVIYGGSPLGPAPTSAPLS